MTDIPEEKIKEFGEKLARTVTRTLAEDRDREVTLRMSSIGKPDRQLWYEHNLPKNLKERLRPENYMKFLYGHLLEDVLLFFAELTGHSVQGQQDVQEISGVKGHRDGVIDGVLVDAKSASSYSFKKFKEGGLTEDDPFGYVKQIQSYLEAGQDDPIIKDKSRAAFFVVDKSLGHLTLDIHEKDTETDFHALYEHKKKVITLPEPPERCYPPKPDGYKNYKTGEFIENGNELLGTNCSYCPFKKECYPDLRVFMSSVGPKFFSKVVKEPKMNEVTDTFWDDAFDPE